MLTIPADIILEKNKLYSGDSFVELLEWQISETGETVRVANYNEDVYWGHNTWSKFRFEGGGETDSGGDSAETIQINVSAIDRVIQGYIETLTNGGIGDTVIYRRVHSAHLELGAAITASFSIVDIDAGPSNEWVTFNLGQENFFLSQFPANVFRRDVCRYRPSQTDVCPYVNNPVCSRSFDNCIYLDQESVFGGQPGIPGGVFNILSIRELLKQLSIDAKLSIADQTKSTSLDARLYSIGSYDEATKLDAILRAEGLDVSLDAIIESLVTKTASLDAKLNVSGQASTSSIDAVLFGSLETTLDAQLKYVGGKPGEPLNTSIDSWIFKTETAQTSLDAIILLTEAETKLDALIQSEGEQSTLSLDAVLYGLRSFSIDAQLEKADNTTASYIDVFLKKTYQSATSIDAKLNGEQVSTTDIDALLYSIGSYSESTVMDAMLYGEFIEDTTGDAIGDTDGDLIEDTTGG